MPPAAMPPPAELLEASKRLQHVASSLDGLVVALAERPAMRDEPLLSGTLRRPLFEGTMMPPAAPPPPPVDSNKIATDLWASFTAVAGA
jgi:hypothetical protein